MGIFRSLGALARAFGPITACTGNNLAAWDSSIREVCVLCRGALICFRDSCCVELFSQAHPSPPPPPPTFFFFFCILKLLQLIACSNGKGGRLCADSAPLYFIYSLAAI
jgi:hypothetical protein